MLAANILLCTLPCVLAMRPRTSAGTLVDFTDPKVRNSLTFKFHLTKSLLRYMHLYVYYFNWFNYCFSNSWIWNIKRQKNSKDFHSIDSCFFVKESFLYFIKEWEKKINIAALCSSLCVVLVEVLAQVHELKKLIYFLNSQNGKNFAGSVISAMTISDSWRPMYTKNIRASP